MGFNSGFKGLRVCHSIRRVTSNDAVKCPTPFDSGM